jgi:hypothetical protein
MAPQRSHSIEFKRQVAQEFIAGESLYALSKRPDSTPPYRLSEPRAIRGSTRPATCQNRRLKLSTIKGALQHRSKQHVHSITSSAKT